MHTENPTARAFTVPDKLARAIIGQGFNLADAPYTIRPQWEKFPIVQAIRLAEKRTGLKWPISEGGE